MASAMRLSSLPEEVASPRGEELATAARSSSAGCSSSMARSEAAARALSCATRGEGDGPATKRSGARRAALRLLSRRAIPPVVCEGAGWPSCVETESGVLGSVSKSMSSMPGKSRTGDRDGRGCSSSVAAGASSRGEVAGGGAARAGPACACRARRAVALLEARGRGCSAAMGACATGRLSGGGAGRCSEEVGTVGAELRVRGAEDSAAVSCSLEVGGEVERGTEGSGSG